MAVFDDLRERVVEAVVLGGLSRNRAAAHFKVSIASAVRWVKRFKTTGEISPAPSGGDRRSGRIEAHHDYLLGLIRRSPDLTLLEIQQRLIANCGDVSSRILMAHSYRVIRRMRYGPDSTRERHNDRGGPSSDTT